MGHHGVQLVKIRAAVFASGSAIRQLRTLLHDYGWIKATLVGLCVWSLATAAFAATVGAGALGTDALACEHPGETFPTLYDSVPSWDLWFNTPWSFAVAVLCIALSMQFAHLTGLRTVIVVAWCSLPWQARWWHGLLMLRECA